MTDGCGSNQKTCFVAAKQKKQRRDGGGRKPQEFERMEKEVVSLSAAFN